MPQLELVINRKLNTETSNFSWKTQDLVDYTKVARLPILEIREAIDLFTGITEFNFIWKILPRKNNVHLQRAKIFYNGPCRKKDQNFKWKDNLYKDFLKMNPSLNQSGEHCIFEGVPGNYDYCNPPGELYVYRPYEEFQFHSFQTELNLYLCKTEFLLHWALFNGIILPEKLQDEFKIIQAKPPTASRNITNIRHTHIQATAQLLLAIEDKKLLSIKDVVNRMEKLVTDYKLQKHWTLEGPLETIYAENLYFKDAKSTTLYQLIREIHPNPRPRGRPEKRSLSLENTHSLKSIPEVFLPTAYHSLSVNYQRLGIVIQTLGYLLYGLKIISNKNEALSHPVIRHYIQTDNFLRRYAQFCLNSVCPSQ